MNQELENNIRIAKYGLAQTIKRMPFGGLNRKDIHDVFMANQPSIYQQQLLLLVNLRLAYKKGDIHLISTILSALKGGFCGDLAEVAKFEMKIAFPEADIEKVELPLHSLLVIGRNQDSDPEKIETWGKNAVMCDPWAQKIYLASKWNEMKNKPSISFFRMRSGELVEVNEHYLSGTPKINTKSSI